jgi:hypothetical protein
MKFSKTVCQSCAAPIQKEYEKGIEKNGGYSETYCRRCYQLGVFTEPKMTAEMMREKVRVKMVEMQFPRFLAVLLANRVYTLKRWTAIKV